MATTYKVTIRKFDPSVDSEAVYKTYEVPYNDPEVGPMTALKALRYINNSIEPVGYDYNCRIGGCSRCIMKFNGNPRLACWARLEEDSENLLEPLDNFPVIKDLVVDLSKGFDKFVQSSATVKTSAPIVVPKRIDPDVYWNDLMKIDRCNECMSCYSVCSALNDFNRWESYIGPGALMQIYAKHLAGEDESDRIAQAAWSGLFQCVQCGKCTEVCSRRIPIAENIAKMQALAEERGLKPADTNAYNWPLL